MCFVVTDDDFIEYRLLLSNKLIMTFFSKPENGTRQNGGITPKGFFRP